MLKRPAPECTTAWLITRPIARLRSSGAILRLAAGDLPLGIDGPHEVNGLVTGCLPGPTPGPDGGHPDNLLSPNDLGQHVCIDPRLKGPRVDRIAPQRSGKVLDRRLPLIEPPASLPEIMGELLQEPYGSVIINGQVLPAPQPPQPCPDTCRPRFARLGRFYGSGGFRSRFARSFSRLAARFLAPR